MRMKRKTEGGQGFLNTYRTNNPTDLLAAHREMAASDIDRDRVQKLLDCLLSPASKDYLRDRKARLARLQQSHEDILSSRTSEGESRRGALRSPSAKEPSTISSSRIQSSAQYPPLWISPSKEITPSRESPRANLTNFWSEPGNQRTVAGSVSGPLSKSLSRARSSWRSTYETRFIMNEELLPTDLDLAFLDHRDDEESSDSETSSVHNYMGRDVSSWGSTASTKSTTPRCLEILKAASPESRMYSLTPPKG